jgi:hypothetical protein
MAVKALEKALCCSDVSDDARTVANQRLAHLLVRTEGVGAEAGEQTDE